MVVHVGHECVVEACIRIPKYSRRPDAPIVTNRETREPGASRLVLANVGPRPSAAIPALQDWRRPTVALRPVASPHPKCAVGAHRDRPHVYADWCVERLPCLTIPSNELLSVIARGHCDQR